MPVFEHGRNDDKDRTARDILQSMRDHRVRPTLTFLHASLDLIERFNRVFQSERVMVNTFFESMSGLYLTFLRLQLIREIPQITCPLNE